MRQMLQCRAVAGACRGRPPLASGADMLIRPEATTDHAAIAAVTRAAFARAAHASGTEAAIIDALRRDGDLALSLVAEDERGAVIGHVAFSPVAVGADTVGVPGWFGLGPVSVAPGHQGRGVGAALIHAGLKAMRAQGAAGIVVLGDPGYYARFGFAAGAFRYGDVPGEYIQHLAFAGAVPGGEVVYARGFSAV